MRRRKTRVVGVYWGISCGVWGGVQAFSVGVYVVVCEAYVSASTTMRRYEFEVLYRVVVLVVVVRVRNTVVAAPLRVFVALSLDLAIIGKQSTPQPYQ